MDKTLLALLFASLLSACGEDGFVPAHSVDALLDYEGAHSSARISFPDVAPPGSSRHDELCLPFGECLYPEPPNGRVLGDAPIAGVTIKVAPETLATSYDFRIERSQADQIESDARDLSFGPFVECRVHELDEPTQCRFTTQTVVVTVHRLSEVEPE